MGPRDGDQDDDDAEIGTETVLKHGNAKENKSGSDRDRPDQSKESRERPSRD